MHTRIKFDLNSIQNRNNREYEQMNCCYIKNCCIESNKKNYAKEAREPSIQCSWLRAIPTEFTHQHEFNCNIHQHPPLSEQKNTQK